MNETPSAENESAFPGRQSAVWLGAGLLAGLLAVLIVTVWDNSRRATLETTAEFTAVEDKHYFPMPDPPPTTDEAVAWLHGQPLYPTDYRRHESPADDMTRVGVDDKAGYAIYRVPEVAKDQDERAVGAIYFLKVSPTEYLKVRAGKR